MEVKISKTFPYFKLQHFRMFVPTFISFKFIAWKDFVLLPTYVFSVVPVVPPSEQFSAPLPKRTTASQVSNFFTKQIEQTVSKGTTISSACAKLSYVQRKERSIPAVDEIHFCNYKWLFECYALTHWVSPFLSVINHSAILEVWCYPVPSATRPRLGIGMAQWNHCSGTEL